LIAMAEQITACMSHATIDISAVIHRNIQVQWSYSSLFRIHETIICHAII
jgi:hypothetical protein